MSKASYQPTTKQSNPTSTQTKSTSLDKYQLIDTGNGRKLEQFGKFKLIRPSQQAVWKPGNEALWAQADAEFIRQGKETGVWKALSNQNIPKKWFLIQNGLKYNIEPNQYGNVGLFPEHWAYQSWLNQAISSLEKFYPKTELKVLNLFSYAGSSILKLISEELNVTNVDSSTQSMDLLNSNLKLNQLENKSRLILDDAKKFLQREVKRGNFYHAILLDPPTFGRGAKGEIFKIQEGLNELLSLCSQLLLPKNFLVLTCHTPGFLPSMLQTLIFSNFKPDPKRIVEVNELTLLDQHQHNLPAGTLATSLLI